MGGISSRRSTPNTGKNPKGIFQGDSLSILLFNDATQPLTKEIYGGYKFSKSLEHINHLMYIDGIKIFAKNKKKLGALIQIIRIYILDIGMEFSIEKYAMLKVKGRKRESVEGIELLNQKCIRTFGEKETTSPWEYWKRTSSDKRR